MIAKGYKFLLEVMEVLWTWLWWWRYLSVTILTTMEAYTLNDRILWHGMQIMSITLWQLFNVDTLRNKIRRETADQCKKECPDSRGGRCWWCLYTPKWWVWVSDCCCNKWPPRSKMNLLFTVPQVSERESVSLGYSHGERAVFLLGPQGSTHSLAFFQLLLHPPSFPHSLRTPPTSASIFNSPSRRWLSLLPLTKAQWLGPAA